ncbi:CDP-glycerol glycerophosphotransferase family protein [Pediococcus acidilactici]|uniref:CDP-glycerol glycerophosphotransferase family protein n=3 Tax=Pediococcus acidilactici TaxID=1254 RepID=UPI000326D83D|nr:CDP-glycerol glycerophosphotransferase family protein [Pediococcus acidilactici]EOA08796.1 CDP-glycerol:glycerophosphate glycerophosphotransferase [Pediococcus acidilactici D3]MBW9307338.1 teichoic acid biosynthesis protein [Pediococcus acidilactici]MCE5962864.1 CDP-glycerol glycerophosphotransferase family protein [Pediococcus acidilactici]MCW8083752.1 CDP-glycerol glycerophosphotransferase family protein [Pediococcus acidilactici]MDB8858107.1 CDP-glycerol glycerophosphotransferase family 
MDIKHNPLFQVMFKFFFSLVNKIIPKKKRIVLYSNWGFRDNVFYLYKYLVENEYNKKLTIVCISNDLMGVEEDNIKNVKYVTSKLKVLWYYLTSKYFVYCFGSMPIKPASSQKVLNLWHGMPLKKIGKLEVGYDNREINDFTYLLSYSPFFNDILEKSFGVEKDKILIANAPRNKPLMEVDSQTLGTEKSIAWLPTYRMSSKLNSSNGSTEFIVPLLKSKEDLQKLDSILKVQNTRLYIKLHPLQDTDNIGSVEDFSNIIFIDEDWLKNKGFDLYTFLAKTDALISDYSSVTIDYLLTDKPIYYIFEDLKDYSTSRGLNYKLSEFVAGKILENKNDLFRVAYEISNKEDSYRKLREEIKNKFFFDERRDAGYILKILEL